MIFLLVALISFAGSLQIGAVNLAVVQTTLNRNLSAGILVAIGGSIPEFIYSFLALKGLFFLQNNQLIINVLNWLIIPVFLLMGLMNLFQNETKIVDTNKASVIKNIDFIKGLSLGMLNPQLLPFWFFILVYLSKYFVINSLSEKYAFILGTGIGAFALLFLFAYLSHYYNERIKKLLRCYSVNRIMGYFFISLAVIQAIKVFV
ncbi:LysE family translocator [Emticicia aquatica]|uniref:LysE family translocator n=1 Tax=Emticicia aquatica TaxID=1681835 RepID=UPI001EE9B7FA|nr:LysE family transporter [Emticicia aquatica]